jgi:hypothetical protein
LKERQEERYKRWENEEEDVSRYWMTLRKERILENGKGSTRSHCVENWL